MPRRSLDPNAKPFEVKVGVGFAAFGGMFQLGDPSMTPAHRFRRLVNVRLGDKDVVSRPGLETQWSGATGAVVGMSEILKRDNGKIWFGPGGARSVTSDDTFALEPLPAPPDFGLVSYQFYALITDAPWSSFTQSNALYEGKLLLAYIMRRFQSANGQDRANSFKAFELASVSRLPFFGRSFGVAPGPYFTREKLIAERELTGPTVDVTGHSHSNAGEVAFSTVAPPAFYNALFAFEHTFGHCLDPLLLFDGKWIHAGSIFPYENSGVLGGKPSGDPGTGQQVFEIVFNTEIPAPPPENLPTVVGGGQYTAAALDNFYGGSATELFRMPGVTNSFNQSHLTPEDGLSIRSMCVNRIRSDDPVSASQATKDKLFLGTFGGHPVAAAYWKVPDVELVPAVHDNTVGAVYSFDGTTLNLEYSGLGPCVVVITLPDGSILACGKTGAALLDVASGAWAAVAYSPTHFLLPRVKAGPPTYTSVEATSPNPDFREFGFIWTDRVLYRGEAYFIGYDTARMYDTVGQFDLLPVAQVNFYGPTPDALVIYRFDRASMTMVKVRSGNDIYTALHPTAWPLANVDPFSAGQANVQDHTCLAVWNDRLFYSWEIGGIVGEPPLTYPTGTAWGVGMFDGSVWDDDAVALDRFTHGPVPLDSGVRACLDMLPTIKGLYLVQLDGSLLTTRSPFLRIWDGSTLNTLLDLALQEFYKGGRLFLGPK